MLRRLLHGMVLATALVSLVTIPTSADAAYSDALGRFSFAAPEGFSISVKDSGDGFAAFTNPRQQAIIYVYSSQLRSQAPLDEYLSGYIADLTKDSNVQLISSQPQATTLGGQSGRQFEYFYTRSSGRLHELVTIAFNGNVIGRTIESTPESTWDAFAPQSISALTGFHFLTDSYPVAYSDQQTRYSFTIPLGWQRDLSLSSDDGTKDVFIGFNPSGNVYIEAHPVEAGVLLEQYVASALSALISTDSTIESDQKAASPVVVAGLSAMQWESFNTVSNVRYHHRLVWLYSGTTRYRLSINTRDDRWDAVLPQAMLILNSIKFS